MIIAINALNPQVAARIARCFDRWKKFDASRQSAARQALEKIRASADVSRDVAEIIEKALV
jgi:aminopeptidase N